MLALYLSARLLYRQRSTLNTIGAAALALLLVDPSQLLGASFQLSFLCVLIIAGVALPILERTTQPFSRALRQLDSPGYDASLPPPMAQRRLDLRMISGRAARFLGKRIPKDYNKQTDSLYWTLHLVWWFPWSLYLPVALRRPISQWMARRKLGAAKPPRPPLDFRSRTEFLCLAWAGVTLVFFSFSTNQEYYTFPAYFPILLLVAARLANEEESGSRLKPPAPL